MDFDYDPYALTGTTLDPSLLPAGQPFNFSNMGDQASALQIAGSVSVPQAPNAGFVIGDWASSLSAVTKTAGGLSDVLNTFYTTRANTQAQIDAAAAAREDRAFNQFTRTAELDLARQRVASNAELGKLQVVGATELGKLNLGAQLANARAALPQNSVFYPFVSGTAPISSYLILAVAGVGIYWLFRKAKHA